MQSPWHDLLHGHHTSHIDEPVKPFFGAGSKGEPMEEGSSKILSFTLEGAAHACPCKDQLCSCGCHLSHSYLGARSVRQMEEDGDLDDEVLSFTFADDDERVLFKWLAAMSNALQEVKLMKNSEEDAKKNGKVKAKKFKFELSQESKIDGVLTLTIPNDHEWFNVSNKGCCRSLPCILE